MADDQNQNQNQQQTQVEGNSEQARTPDGTLKDQNSIQPSGDQNKAPQPEANKSFLNREPEKAPDKKPEGEKAPEGEKKPEDVKAGAPEKYEDFKLPEGYKLDDKVADTVSKTFKELGLSQEAGQKLIDIYAENSIQAAQAPYDLWAKTQTDWVGEIDNRFGSKAETMRTDINKAIDTAITSPKLRGAFREALDLTGFGSNPDAFEALSIFAKPFLEGTPVRGGAPSKEGTKAPASDSRPSIADAMYPHLVQNRGGQ